MKISPDVILSSQEARNELSPLLEDLDFRIFSKYNIGYLRYQKDPTRYFIDMEINRFLYTANYINANFPKTTRILDIGVFIPVLPIMLAKLGYQVEAIEKLSLYENTLDTIIEFVGTKYNVKIHDIDIINGNSAMLKNRFDIVLLMAVLEHLNGSPKRLLEKCKNLLRPSGFLFVDGPNIASMPKRISFLIKGKSPLPEYSDYFLSEYPFEGHNREYSLNELQYALKSTGFEIIKYDFLNITLPPDSKLVTRIIKTLDLLQKSV
jgi:2-polyprenyl-3-methyl-5-hydroxy-6-metoxy-1,4-benzoquinol methylase